MMRNRITVGSNIFVIFVYLLRCAKFCSNERQETNHSSCGGVWSTPSRKIYHSRRSVRVIVSLFAIWNCIPETCAPCLGFYISKLYTASNLKESDQTVWYTLTPPEDPWVLQIGEEPARNQRVNARFVWLDVSRISMHLWYYYRVAQLSEPWH